MQKLLCPLSTLRHGHQREEAVLPRGEGLREQPNFPRKDTARSRHSRRAIQAEWTSQPVNPQHRGIPDYQVTLTLLTKSGIGKSVDSCTKVVRQHSKIWQSPRL